MLNLANVPTPSADPEPPDTQDPAKSETTPDVSILYSECVPAADTNKFPLLSISIPAGAARSEPKLEAIVDVVARIGYTGLPDTATIASDNAVIKSTALIHFDNDTNNEALRYSSGNDNDHDHNHIHDDDHDDNHDRKVNNGGNI